MDSILLELIRLHDPDNMVRLEACEQLALERDPPVNAIMALKQASHDPNPRVAEAALRALHLDKWACGGGWS
jgi:hypothetical protein